MNENILTLEPERVKIASLPDTTDISDIKYIPVSPPDRSFLYPPERSALAFGVVVGSAPCQSEGSGFLRVWGEDSPITASPSPLASQCSPICRGAGDPAVTIPEQPAFDYARDGRYEDTFPSASFGKHNNPTRKPPMAVLPPEVPHGGLREGRSPCLSIGANGTDEKQNQITTEIEVFASDVVFREYENVVPEGVPLEVLSNGGFSGVKSVPSFAGKVLGVYRKHGGVGKGGGLRKDIHEFTRQIATAIKFEARNQSLLNRKGISGLACVTYGDKALPRDSVTFDIHLDRFTKRLGRRGVKGIFVKEFQPERGGIHAHFILSESVPPKDWGRWWCECSGQADDPDAIAVNSHRKQSQKMRCALGAFSYAAKYCSKADDQKTIPENFNWSGRWWGRFGLPTAKKPREKLTPALKLKRQLERILRRKVKSEQGAYYRSRVVEAQRISLNALLNSDLPDGCAEHDSAYFLITRSNGHSFRGWESVSRTEVKALRSTSVPYRDRIRMQPKIPSIGKHGKISFYGQGDFFMANRSKLENIWAEPLTKKPDFCYKPEVTAILNIMGGSVVGFQHPVHTDEQGKIVMKQAVKTA